MVQLQGLRAFDDAAEDEDELTAGLDDEALAAATPLD